MQTLYLTSMKAVRWVIIAMLLFGAAPANHQYTTSNLRWSGGKGLDLKPSVQVLGMGSFLRFLEHMLLYMLSSRFSHPSG